MYTENERVVCLKLRNYARIWNAYSEIGWLLQPNYETTADFRTYALKILGWFSSNYETTLGFETHIVKLEGCSSQTTKLRQILECLSWKSKVRLGWASSNYETTPGFETYIVKMEGWSGQTTKLQGNLEHVYWKWKGGLPETTKLRQDLKRI